MITWVSRERLEKHKIMVLLRIWSRWHFICGVRWNDAQQIIFGSSGQDLKLSKGFTLSILDSHPTIFSQSYYERECSSRCKHQKVIPQKLLQLKFPFKNTNILKVLQDSLN